jgi:hypothetical protein
MSEEKIESKKLSKSEMELGQKWDRCLTDAFVKTGSGIGVGLVFSLLFFRSNFCFSNKIFLKVKILRQLTENINPLILLFNFFKEDRGQ